MIVSRFKNHTIVFVTVSSIALSFPFERASANDAVIGVIGGFLANEMLRNSQNRSQQQARTVQRAPQPWSAERQHRASVQQALNGMGYQVGTADGVYGGKTANGMRNFQAAMGYPVTGTLSPFEERALLGAHASYSQGAHHSQFPGLYDREGMPGLVRAHADPSYYASRYGNAASQGYGAHAANQGFGGNSGAGGIAAGAVGAGALGAGAMAQHGGQVGQGVPTNTEAGMLAGHVPGQQIHGSGSSQSQLAPLVPINPIGKVTVSMEEHCDFVKLSTQTNGGQILANSMTDPEQALGEQFCDARTYLMGQVTSTLNVARATEDQLMASCGSIKSAMAPLMGGLSGKTTSAVVAEAAGISGSFGLTDATAAADYGAVCIGLGYRNNDPEVALTGALMLVGAGRMPFAEMVAHHAREGFGTPENVNSAMEWYSVGLEALDANQPPAVLPSQSIQRTAIIRAAVGARMQNAQGSGAASIVPVANQITPLNLGGN